MRGRLATIAVALAGVTFACRRRAGRGRPRRTPPPPPAATLAMPAPAEVAPAEAPAPRAAQVPPHRRPHAHRPRRHRARAAADGRMGDRRRREPVGDVSRDRRAHAGDAARRRRRGGRAASPSSRRRTSGWCAPTRTTARRWPAKLDEAKRLGARGLKITKGLGLGYPAADGSTCLPSTIRAWIRCSRRAGALGMPVAIHIGDPKAFWQPVDARQRALGRAARPPRVVVRGGRTSRSWQALYDAFERLVARHPKTTFIGVHFGNDPEDPDNVARMLDKLPEPLRRHRGPRPRDRPPPAGEDAAAVHASTRTASCSAPTPASAPSPRT